MGSIGPTELLIILAIVVVFFGGSRLPKLARSLGEARREFEKGTTSPAEETPAPMRIVTADHPTSEPEAG